MLNFLKKSGLNPKALVIAPLLVLTSIFVLLAGLLLISGNVPTVAAAALLAGGVAIYAVAAAMLFRMGISNLARLESLGRTDSLSLLPNRRALHHDTQAVLDRQ